MRRLILTVLVLLGGCGYELVGLAPEGMRALAVGFIQGIQEEPGFETTLREALKEELQSRGIEVEEEAPLTIRGRIEGIGFHTVAYDESARAKQYRVSVTVDLALYEGDKERWHQRFCRDKVFTVQGDSVLDDRRKDEALKAVAKDLAEDLYLKLATDSWSLGSQ